MKKRAEEKQEEERYLVETISYARVMLEEEKSAAFKKKNELIDARKDMYENTSHSSQDYDKLSEMVQYMNSLNMQTLDYEAGEQRIKKYERIMRNPYFARIDFREDNEEEEKIYIGLRNLTDEKTWKTYVYDWRAPISGLFYRYELGRVEYEAPCGTIRGEVSLKRQYEIEKGKLNFFFDTNVNVLDDILQKALSGNTSQKMKIIVETIQREQDVIIRDIENDLVIIQGVAGSGKTSVALHRVAFLLYQSIKSELSMSNIVFISPNSLFGQYIEDVLPELGEGKISTLTFEDIFSEHFPHFSLQSKNEFLEELIVAEDNSRELLKEELEFKLSEDFRILLERYYNYYERRIHKFEDIHFHGECVADRFLLKELLLNKNKRDISLEGRLLQIRTRIMDRLQELKAARIAKLEKFVLDKTDHPFDTRAFARLLAAKQHSALRERVEHFTRVDILKTYRGLFADQDLFYRLAKGLGLPEDCREMLERTTKRFEQGKIGYADGMALLYLKLKLGELHLNRDIKQVMVDEAQDYYPLHFRIMRLLFPQAKYTIVGDINQAIEKSIDLSGYEQIREILKHQKSTTVRLNKSFRCSYEISNFSSKFLASSIVAESFERHEAPPQIVQAENALELEENLLREIESAKKEGLKSLAIICKSKRQAEFLYARLISRVDIRLVCDNQETVPGGAIIIPVYLAKGLEFDGVLIYAVDELHYRTAEDKKLLYIACTRALHRLSLHYTGKISNLLTEKESL